MSELPKKPRAPRPVKRYDMTTSVAPAAIAVAEVPPAAEPPLPVAAAEVAAAVPVPPFAEAAGAAPPSAAEAATITTMVPPPEAIALASPPPAEPAAESVTVPPVAPSIPSPFKEKSIMATQFETAQDTVKNTVHTLNTNAESAMANGKAAMEQVAAKSREAVEQGMKSIDELTAMARGNVEAMLASARAATSGIETLAQHVAEFSRKSFEDTTAAARAMASVKSPNELLQLQNDFAKTQFDAAIGELSKVSELLVKTAGEVFEPVQNRMAIAADKIKSGMTK